MLRIVLDSVNGISRRFACRGAVLWRDQQGAAMVYATIMVGVLFGFAALAIDFGRLATTNTQARAAAEAAALAAASQLDGTADAITRATNAAQSTPLVQNQQNLAQSPGNVAISALRFLNGLPAGTPGMPENPSVLDPFVTTDPLEARFVEVTTQTLTQSNMFAQAGGGGVTSTTRGTAVAGFTQVICQRAPLAICNPAEAGGNIGATFEVGQWRGRQVLAKASGPSSSWVPGDFGLVDIDGLQSTPEIADALAASEPDVCVTATVDLKPGQTQGARQALNTRFDMYANPFFGGNERNMARYRPARNVTKGLVQNGGNQCSFVAPASGARSMALPRDANISSVQRVGNGTWNCQSYWDLMHGAGTRPSNCTVATTPSDWTRYDLYRHEIDNPPLPDHSGDPIVGERAAPRCSSVTPSDTPDRRILVFAVINCLEHGPLSGNSAGPVPVEAFVKAFMTEPTGAPPDVDTYLEIVDVVRPGADDGILHDIVQLYR